MNTPAQRKALYWKDPEKHRAAKRAKRAANPDKYRKLQYAWMLKSRHGITLGEYEALLDGRRGTCAICYGEPKGKKKLLSVDHWQDYNATVGSALTYLCREYANIAA